MRATTSGKGSPQLKHFPSSQERQTLATRSAKEAPHKMHFVVVILRHLQPSSSCLFRANRRSPLLHGRHGGLPLPFATHYSLLAVR